MASALLIAVVVGLIAVGGQLLLSRTNAKQRREEKAEDWTRQDAVAAKAAEAASLLLAENKKVAATAVEQKAQLKEIHTLVNSNMTAAMQAQLVALKGQLVLMERLAERTVSTEDELAAIKAVQGQISELEAALRDRLEATDVAAAAAAAAAAATTTTTTTVTK